VLAFVLDCLLPQCQSAGDRDCPALARVFVASLASCNHSPDAQLTLVSEVKAALQRALALLESSEKHAKIQALTGIISVLL
jgi:E3 ubiquitin-protein ligase HUWE1